MIVEAFAEKYIQLIAEVVENKVAEVLGVEDELQSLQEKLEDLIGHLWDAERKRLRDPDVGRWLKRLKDIMYDADDLVDLCKVKAEKHTRSLANQASASHINWLVRSFRSALSYIIHNHDMSSRIRNVKARLEEITSDKMILSKLEHTSKRVTDACGVDHRQTSPVLEADIVGDDIQHTAENMVEFLCSGNQHMCLVAAIWGMPGVGKTTLAQKIFSNHRMMTRFDTRIWLCITQEFSEMELLKQITRGLGVTTDADSTKAELVQFVATAASSRSLLIVLDDVWQPDIWNDLLRNPIQSTACARILVTTRYEHVAKQVGSTYIHKMSPLPDDSSWELFYKKVYQLGKETEIEELKDVGTKILQKCQGLPLAIKAVATLLRQKDIIREEWEKVLRSDAWFLSNLPKELRGALFLSYEDLPSHLKQCFLYCSLFPPGWLLHREHLPRYWVSEGFVIPQGDSLLEDLAEEYYDELVRRSLLDPTPAALINTPCIMHDLVRSLAQFLSADECFYGEIQKLNDLTRHSRLRRFSAADMGQTMVLPPSMVAYQQCLRTFMLLQSPAKLRIDSFASFSHLRFLLLNGPGIESIHDSLGSLVQLRHLDFSCTNISKLPNSIGCLTNLLNLNLLRCQLLKTLPEGITQLCSLRHLGLRFTPLRYLPKGIGNLMNMNSLVFIVRDESEGGGEQGCNLQELELMSELRSLGIDKMERALQGSTDLSKKTVLRCLGLFCTPEAERPDERYKIEEKQRVQEIFESLRLPPLLQNLKIHHFCGGNYPSWMVSRPAEGNLINLTMLNLSNCMSWLHLPPLGQLPCLKFLKVENASSVRTIGSEFLGCGVRKGRAPGLAFFPKLERIMLYGMPVWEHWSLTPGAAAAAAAAAAAEPLLLFPSLKRMDILYCPELIALPEGLRRATTLQELRVQGAHKLARVGEIPSLTWLGMLDCRQLEVVSNISSIRSVGIVNCPEFKCMDMLESVQTRRWKDKKVECPPE